MKLYYAPGACSLANHIALLEARIPHAIDKVDIKTKITESGSDFREINPKGYVPALQLDTGEILTETLAILIYISDYSGRLLPADGIERYHVLAMLAYISAEIHKSFIPFFAPGSSYDVKASARVHLAKQFEILAGHLSGREYLSEYFSVADCYLFVTLFWARCKAYVNVPLRLIHYYDSLSLRESIQHAFRVEGL